VVQWHNHPWQQDNHLLNPPVAQQHRTLLQQDHRQRVAIPEIKAIAKALENTVQRAVENAKALNLLTVQ
jgi:hypothetical protein